MVRPKWIASTPIDSVVVMELRTGNFHYGEETVRGWLIPETTFDYTGEAFNLFPLGYQEGSYVAAPFATVSGQSPEAFRVGPTTDDGTLYELRYQSGTTIQSIDLKLSPFKDLTESYTVNIESDDVTVATDLVVQSSSDLTAESLEACEPIDVDDLIKQPGNSRGTCSEAYGVVFQYDTNTGSCAFLADIGTRKSTQSYDFTDTVWFGFGSSSDQFDQVRDCPVLDGVDQDDFIQIWATGAGTFTYTSTGGATLTLPAMSIISVDVYKKN